MLKKKFTCYDCDAFGSIKISNDADEYEILVCPACGSELNIESDEEDSDDE